MCYNITYETDVEGRITVPLQKKKVKTDILTLRAPSKVKDGTACVIYESIHSEGYRERRSDHVGECFILEIVTAGKGVHVWDGEKSELSRADVYLISPITPHRIDSSGIELISVYFTEETVGDELSRLLSFAPPLITRYTLPELEELLHDIDGIAAEENARNPFSSEMGRAILTKVLITFLRKCSLGPSESPFAKNKTADLMLSYILHNLRREITLRDIAEAVGITPNYLGESFIEATGVTCSTFVRDERLKMAKRLLRGTGLSVESISAICGFGSVSYFTRIFRESFEVTPFTFRRTGHSEKD